MSLDPYPSLRIRFLVGGFSAEATALVDSGFDEHLAVPQVLVADLPPESPLNPDRQLLRQVTLFPSVR
jgi:hypothetical protein